jgi:hypothetical protein
VEQRHFKLAALALAGFIAAAPLAADQDTTPNVSDSLEDLRASLGTLANQVNNLQGSMDKEIVWNVNTDTRYDYAAYKVTTGQLSAASAAFPLVKYTANGGSLSDLSANGYVGMYIKRAELEATGKISPWAVWNLQFDFAGLKLEDTGVDAKGMDLLPYLNVPGYTWEAKVGLYRQPFGVENQTGSSALPFPERAIMDGGYSPVSIGTVKLVYERIMGIQMITSHNYGPVGYKLQAAIGDDQKDQDAGSSATVGAFGGASPASNTYTAATASAPSLGLTTDGETSEFGRLGIDLNFVPSIVTVNVGGSLAHLDLNTALLPANPAPGASQAWQDNTGADATVGFPMAQTTFQAEWVAQNSYNNATAKVPGKLVSRAEGWYVESTTKPLALFDKDWTSLDLNLRIESVAPNVNIGASPAFVAHYENASTLGLKWYYGNRTYTSVNYTTYALNGNYGAIAGSQLFSVQQQFYF